MSVCALVTISRLIFKNTLAEDLSNLDHPREQSCDCGPANITQRISSLSLQTLREFMHTLASSLQANCSFHSYSATYLTGEMLSEKH